MTDVNVNLRMVVLEILNEIESGEKSHLVIRNALKKYQYLSKADRSFISKLSLGVVEKRIELDYIINQFSNTKTQKQKPVIRNILRMGVYQLKYMDKIPASAACNEAVKLANKKGFSTLKGFVNGVLRNISRQIDNIDYPDRDGNFKEYASVRYSMPVWIIEMWLKSYDTDTVENMLKGFDLDKQTYIRCNTNIINPDKLKKELESDNISVSFAKQIIGKNSIFGINIPDYALVISDYDYLESIDAFNQGKFYVQDISSMLAQEGAIKDGDYCVDVCAAPGGKSINAAFLNPNGCVDSRDVSDLKVSLIEDNIYRLGIDNISTKVWDATVKDESIIEKADVVIADVPCSGLGIMGRKPDIRYNVTPDGLNNLNELQKDILSVVNSYVKPGGLMIYSTCTVSKTENEDNINWFLENYPFTLEGKMIQIKPGDIGNDGFFIARLRKGI